MKRIVIAGMVAGAAMMLLMAPQQMARAASSNVSISVDMHLTGQTSAEGTFTASGAINDSGTATETFQIAGDGKSVQGDKTLVGSKGNVSLHFSGPITPVQGSSSLQVSGTWQVVSGTQAYSGITGSGQINTILDPNAGTLHADYTGEVSLAGATGATPGMPSTGAPSGAGAGTVLLVLAAAMLAGGITLAARAGRAKRGRAS